MREKIEIDDSFEEKEKDTENENKKREDDNEANIKNDIDILAIKTFKTETCKEDDDCKNFQDKISQQTCNILKRLLKISIYLIIFTGIEFVGSYSSNSVGVLTITAGLFTDLIKTLITIISILIIQNPANEVMTYGYHRSEIISSLCSILIVLVLSIWIVDDSFETINLPKQLNGKLMIIFSFLGLCFNLIIRYIKGLNPVPDVDEGKFLKNYNDDKDLNTPLLDDYLDLAAKDDDKIVKENMAKKQLEKIQHKEYIHLICDISQSLLTIIASLCIYYYELRFPWVKYIDDLCSITFLIIMLIITWPITKECIDILMEAAPREINIKTLYNELKDVNGVMNIHDIHLWSLSIGRPCITMHILSNNPQKSLEGATKICKKYGINHCTIQVEDSNEARRLSYNECDMNKNYDNHKNICEKFFLY